MIDKLGLVPVPSLIFSGAILFRKQYQQEMDDITFQNVLRLAKKNVEKMEGATTEVLSVVKKEKE